MNRMLICVLSGLLLISLGFNILQVVRYREYSHKTKQGISPIIIETPSPYTYPEPKSQSIQKLRTHTT